MSNTTRLRTIIENGVDIGLQDYNIFDETYRAILNSNIINEYYFDPPINFETTDRFIHEINQRMSVIMYKYNELYKSQLLSFDPLTTFKRTSSQEKDIKSKDSGNEQNKTKEKTDTTDDTTGLRKDKINSNSLSELENSNKTTGNVNQNGSVNENNKNASLQLDSKTPNGQLLTADINDKLFASNVNKKDDTNNINRVNNNKESNSQDSVTKDKQAVNNEQKTLSDITSKTTALTDKDIENLIVTTMSKIVNEKIQDDSEGYEISPSELLKAYRSTFLNIDYMIIKEVRDMFSYIYDDDDDYYY